VVIVAWKLVVAKLPEAKLLMVGDRNGLDFLRETVAKSLVREAIKVLGFVPEENAANLGEGAFVRSAKLERGFWSCLYRSHAKVASCDCLYTSCWP
jgi:glycosyltransferase involved in cell wall biosynthesis